jgi:hypothetical protein
LLCMDNSTFPRFNRILKRLLELFLNFSLIDHATWRWKINACSFDRLCLHGTHISRNPGVGNARSNLHVVVCRRRASICVLGDELRMVALAMITQTDQDGDAPKKGRFERD